MKTQNTLKSALLTSAAFAVVVPTMALAAIKVGNTLGTDEAAIINALEVAGYERIEVEFEDGILEAEGWDPVNAMEMEFEIDPATGLVSVVSGAFGEFLQHQFRDWDLSPSESDVALFAIKGSSIAEIARMRGTKDGTIKAQLNAIYRKAGVTGRPQLISFFIDEMVDGIAPAA